MRPQGKVASTLCWSIFPASKQGPSPVCFLHPFPLLPCTHHRPHGNPGSFWGTFSATGAKQHFPRVSAMSTGLPHRREGGSHGALEPLAGWEVQEHPRPSIPVGPVWPVGAWFHHGTLLVLHWHQEVRGCGPMWQHMPWDVTPTATPIPSWIPSPGPSCLECCPWSLQGVSGGHQGVPFIPQ